MDNGIGIVGERTGETEDGAAQMEAAPAGAVDSHGTNGQMKDSDEHEVFEDTVTDAESFYMPHRLDAKNAFVGKVGSGIVSEGNNGDAWSSDADANDHSSGKEHDASEVVESVTSSQVNDICSGKLETVAAEAVACPEEEPGISHESISELNADDSHSGVAEDLNIDVVTEEDSYFSQKLAERLGGDASTEGLEKQEAVDSHAMTEAADEFEFAPRIEDGEGTREIKMSSHESNGKAYTVPNNDGEIVPDSANEVLGTEKPVSGVIVDEVSFSKAGDADGFKYEEDISNKHELQELQSEIIDDVTGHDELKAETDSLLVDGVSTNSNETHENEHPLKQSGINRTIPQGKSNVEEVASKESVLVEDLGDLSSTDDDESNSFSQQELPSHSQPSSAPSLPSCPAGLGSSAPLLEPAPHSLQELQSEIIDDVTGHDEIKAETDSLLVDGVSTNSNDTHENEDPLKQSGINRTIPQGTSNVEEVASKEFVLVEDLGDLSSTDDEESNSFSQQELPSHSQPSSAPSLPSRPAGLGSSAPLLEPAPRSLQGLQSKIIDDVTGHDEIKAEKDSLLVDGVSTNSNDTHENENPLKQSGVNRTIPQSTSNVEEVASKESVLVEDLGDLSSTDDDESNSFSQQELPSHSQPSAAPSLPSRPVGLGSSAPLLEPAPRSLHSPRANGSVPRQQTQISEDSVSDDTEESDEIREKLQMIRVKFLRLAHRLGQTPHNVVVAQVLYRLGLAEQLRRNINRPGVFSFDRASVMAEQLEAAGQEPLDFSCTILVIGKTGVGKSSTINSILDDAKLCTDAFQLATKKVQNVMGTVQGIKVRVIDTPGLSSCSTDHRHNEQILNSIKRFISKTSPDIVLYFDRLDMQSRDYGDVTLLRTITDVFGASIWFNAIVVLTHAASAPPDGPNGTPLSYEMFVTQRSHVVQQAIRQAAGDVRLMNPISLVENHSACRMNRAGQRVLPNGQVWKPQLLLLSFASKILQEANMLLKLEDSPPGKPFGSRARVPPLPFLLSSLLQSRPQLKLPEEQMLDEDNLFEDLGETSDSDDGSDYDELPPFKCLTRSQLAKLSKVQRKAYYEELDYREKLFFKKQLKEEKKRRKLLKKMADSIHDVPHNHNGENLEDESGGPASVPVPMPDLVLPNSFDSDYPSHRYRFLDSSNRWLVRPVLETQGWDHDVGYEGLNVERLLVVKDKIPLSISGQLTKDKKDCTVQMEVASSIKHSEGRASSVGLDLQTVGKDMAYTLRGETKFKNFRCNNTAAGVSVTILGESASTGVKIEDKLVLNKRLSMLISGGAMSGRGDIAYGGRLEATLRDKDHPIGRSLSTIALSIVDWHGDLAVGCNIQTQHSIGWGTNVICHGNLSNKGNGQVGIRLNSSDQLQIALFALLPIFKSAMRMFFVSHQPM